MGRSSAAATPTCSRAMSGSWSTLAAIIYYDLYQPTAEWPALGTLLQDLYAASAAGAAIAEAPLIAAASYPVSNVNEGYYISQCADIEVPTHESVYDSLATTENAKV